MKILNPIERAEAEQRVAEIVRQRDALPAERSAEQARQAAELEQELATLEKKLRGIGPPRAG